jgi:GntP family gluconate:H+ symporter
MVLWPRYVRLNAFFSLLTASVLFSIVVGTPAAEVVTILQTGFGTMIQQIGIIVALGSVLGIVLEKTGAMEVISTSILKAFGSKRSVLALAVIGTIVGIPVFCDSGFIILSRLIPSLALKTSVAPGSLVLALSSGLYTTHVLVPPTPGPLAAAANLGLGDNLGIVILVGLLASVPVALVAYVFSLKVGPGIAIVQEASIAPEQKTSIYWVRALLPLLAPILLIALAAAGKLIDDPPHTLNILFIMGIPVVALMIGVLLSFTLIDRSHHKQWPDWITEALKDAGIIILITGAGGAFGAVIKTSGIANIISSSVTGSDLYGTVFLLVAWLLAAVLKTAQGSSTSSMIITSSLMAPLASAAGLSTSTDLAILIVAIGGGSIAVSHANDSYFWVVSQFGKLSPKDALARFTPMTLVQGITALVTAVALHFVL